MATETQTGLSGHVRGVTVTTLACLAGVAASVAAVVVVGTSPEAASDTRALAFLVAAVVGQYPLLKTIGVDVSDFGAKDHLYVAFMTFTLWFISFAILLTTGATV
jgi:P pilus assembly chaperone PapD